MRFWKKFFNSGKKEIVAAIDLMGNSRTRDSGIEFFHDKSSDEVIPILKQMFRSNDRFVRNSAITALGHLGRSYGWKEIVPVLEKIIISKYKETISDGYEEDMSGEAVAALDWASYNSTEPLFKTEIEQSVDRVAEILRKAANRDLEYSMSSNPLSGARGLLKTFKPELLIQIDREREIARIGEKNYHILEEAREAAKVVMRSVDRNENASLLLYMMVISKLGEERIDNLYFGPPEEHIMEAGAKEFQSILKKHNIEASVESRLD